MGIIDESADRLKKNVAAMNAGQPLNVVTPQLHELHQKGQAAYRKVTEAERKL